jgi:hypothetical protein
MRLAIAAACLALSTTMALSQSQQQGSGQPTPATPHSTGQTVAPETKGQKQPQGHTGPINTEGPSAPASSPQGQTPPGMHAAPEGSDKTVVEPKQ